LTQVFVASTQLARTHALHFNAYHKKKFEALINAEVDKTHVSSHSQLINNNVQFLSFPDQPWVTNLTDLTLNKAAHSLLAKDPKFIPTPGFKPVIPFFAAKFESASLGCKNLAQLRSHALQGAKLLLSKGAQHNLTHDELEAIKQLRNNHSIAICSADKSNSNVVISSQSLETMIHEQLNNKALYLPVNYDPEDRCVALITNFFLHLGENGLIPPKKATEFTKLTFLPPHVFAQVKTHKPNNPIRLITSGKEAPNLPLCKLIAPTLKLMSIGQHTALNSNSVVSDLENKVAPPDYEWTSFDVESMFPSLDQNHILECISAILQDDSSFLDQLGWPIPTFLDAVKIVFATSYVLHNKQFFFQIQGVPMGSPLSTYLCDIVLNSIDKKLMASHSSDIAFYKRFIDDSLMLSHKSVRHTILKFFNNQHPSLRYTMEAQPTAIAFLDIKAIINPDRRISFVHYRKPTQTTRTTHFTSYTDIQYRLAGLKSEIKRVFAHTTSKCLLSHEFRYIIYKYLQNGFPLHILLKYANIRWASTHKPAPQADHTKAFLPFLHNITPVLKPLYKQCNKQLVSVNHSNLAGRLRPSPSLEFQRPTILCRNAVYRIKCPECPAVYLGESKQELRARASSHKSEFKFQVPSNSIVQHFNKTGHEPNFRNLEILAQIPFAYTRKLFEALCIHVHTPPPHNHIIPSKFNLFEWVKLLKPLNYNFRPQRSCQLDLARVTEKFRRDATNHVI
jgi:hypothetical protein